MVLQLEQSGVLKLQVTRTLCSVEAIARKLEAIASQEATSLMVRLPPSVGLEVEQI